MVPDLTIDENTSSVLDEERIGFRIRQIGSRFDIGTLRATTRSAFAGIR